MKPSLDSSTLVVVPTFNNAETLGGVIASVLKHTDKILVVNDGSTDATPAVIAEFPGIASLVLARNSGKGEALLQAFLWARERGYEYVVSMDADGQHLADDLPAIATAIESNRGALIVGARDFGTISGDVPGSSKFGRAFSDFWVRLESGIAVFDTQSGFRAYPVARIPIEALTVRRYDFEIEILVRSLWAGIPVLSVPIHVYYPDRAKRVSHFLPFKDNARLSRLHTRLVLTRLLHLLTGRAHSAQGRRGPGAMALSLRLLGHRGCYWLLFLVLPFYFVTGFSHVAPNIRFHRQRGITSLLGQLAASWRTHLFFAASLLDRAAMAAGLYTPTFARDVPPSIFERDGGFVLVGAHFGDWTLSSTAFAGERTRRVAVVMDAARSRLFQNQTGLFNTQALDVVDVSKSPIETILAIRHKIAAGDIVCFLGDRGSTETRMVPISFLGREAHFPAAPFEVATRLKAPLYAFFCFKESLAPHVPWRLVIREIQTDTGNLEKTMGRYVRELESLVRTHPHCWFNFFDFWNFNPGAK
jgi:predicted LPLAT superfamily acyltransferase